MAGSRLTSIEAKRDRSRGEVYVNFYEGMNGHAGVIRLSYEGWLDLKDRIDAYHPNGTVIVTEI